MFVMEWQHDLLLTGHIAQLFIELLVALHIALLELGCVEL